MTRDYQESKNVSKHTASNLATNLIPMFVALITIPFYLSYIGEERFGVLALIMAFLTYFNFMDMGLGRAVSRRIAQLHKDTNLSRSNVLWTTTISSLFLGIIGGFILWISLESLLNSQVKISPLILIETKKAILYLALALPLLLPISSFIGALHARYNFNEANMVMILTNTLVQVIPLFVAINGYVDVSTLVLTTLIIKISSSIILFLICSKLIPLNIYPVFNKEEFVNMISYGGWVSVLGIITPLLTTIDRVVIASVSGARFLTYYVIPYDLVTKIMVIPGSFSSALFPRLVKGNEEDSFNMAITATKTLITVMTPVLIIGLLLINDFLSIWVGSDISNKAKNIGEILLIGLWINALVIPTYSRHLARFDPKTIVIIFLIEIPIYLALLFFGLKYFGIQGAAVAWTLRVLLDTVLILKVNDLLYEIFTDNFYSAVLVFLAIYVYLADIGFIYSLLISLSLLMVSAMKDIKVLKNLYEELIA